MEFTSSNTSSSAAAGTIAARTQQCLNEMKSLPKPANVVLIIGRAGVGKSSLLEDLTGSTGHSQQTVDSVVVKFEIEKAVLGNQDYFIMDTPGFTAGNEHQIFREIVRGIQAIRKFAHVAGIVYVTHIHQRFDQFDQRLDRFINALCGPDYSNLTLVTTFWTAQGQTQQDMFNQRLDLLLRRWRDVVGVEQAKVKTYQHGRQYKAGQVTGEFLNWYDDRDEIAQHAKDMITRNFGGQPTRTPRILRELEDSIPLYDTDAGRVLSMLGDTGRATSSAGMADDAPRERYQVPRDEWEPPSWSEPRRGPSSNSRSHVQTDNTTSEIPWGSIFDFMKEGYSWLSRNNLGPFQSHGAGGPSFGASASYRRFGDPNSVVDVMKSFGMDSSLSGRQQYAAANGITGAVGSAAWNTAIRRHLSGGF